jgi:GT2 family glycosyltransferase
MISIVVVNWNSGPFLERCISSIRRHASDCETIVVDNSSTDSSLDFAIPGGLVLLRNSSNLGFAGACNRGWRSAAGELILFLNPDAECSSSSVPGLARVFGEEPEVAAAGGALIGPSGDRERSARSFPSLASVRAEMILLDEIWPRNPWTRRYRLGGWSHSSFRDIDQPAGACLMVRRAMLDRLGGFDERFHPAWFEDVDLCRRIRDLRSRIVYVPDAVFLHHGGYSVGALGREEFLYHFHKNQIRYFRKHHGEAAARAVRRWAIAGMRIRALAGALVPAGGTKTGVFRRVAVRLAADREESS